MRVFAVACVAIVMCALPPAALADGDPASDVLIGQRVFYPYGSNVPPSVQSRLNAETAAASRAHFPVKVALIATPADLGAVPTLFGKPKQYAAFLVQEISFLNVKPLLLVLMPNGYGAEHLGSAAQAALASLKTPGAGGAERLAQAAIVAVPKLAAAAGHPIGSVAGAGGTGAHGGSSALKAIVLAMSAIVFAGALTGFRTVRVRRYASRGNERRGHG
jgi:hypothetical protein